MADASLPVERQPSPHTLALPTGTPAFPAHACPPDGNASLTVERQRYSASKRPEDKRTPTDLTQWETATGSEEEQSSMP